jgi:hypothetical protein
MTPLTTVAPATRTVSVPLSESDKVPSRLPQVELERNRAFWRMISASFMQVSDAHLHRRNGRRSASVAADSAQNATPEPADMAINHRTQLPSLFISRLGFAPRFRASGFASATSGIHWHVNLKYPLCVLNCTQLHNIRITPPPGRSFMFELLFTASATRSRRSSAGARCSTTWSEA